MRLEDEYVDPSFACPFDQTCVRRPATAGPRINRTGLVAAAGRRPASLAAKDLA